MIPDLLRRAAGNAVAGDPYYSAVSLLLHFNGANGSTTFTDSSSNNLTVTPSGNAQISTAQSKFGGAAGSFNGTGGYLSPSNSAGMIFGTSDFTVEFWFYANSIVTGTSGYTAFMGFHNGGTEDWGAFARNSGVFIYGGGVGLVGGGTVNTGTWYHFAACRSGTTVRSFLNGTQVGIATGVTGNYTNNAGNSFRVGDDYSSTNPSFDGYIDDLRITKGVARYTANFTVPSAPYPDRIGSIEADAYFPQTSLLLHMDGTNGSTSFVDSGPNALAVTASGNAQISTTQSKFGGAAGYFASSSSSYISTTSGSILAFGSGDFTVEAWIYLNDTNANATKGIVAGVGSNCFGFRVGQSFQGNVNGLGIYKDQVADCEYCSYTFSTNTWYHVAVVRTSSTIKYFINGTLQTTLGSGAASFDYPTPTTVRVGATNPAGEYFNGYIDDLRITKSARYTSNFTPRAKAFPDIYNPYKTLPVSGAALWLAGDDSSTLFTDAGVTPVKVNGDLVYQWNDKSGNSRHATQTTSGNRPTWVPPASGRNGLGALAFNGSQTILTGYNQADFGTGDFTIEAWIYTSDATNIKAIAGTLKTGFDGGWQIRTGSSKFYFGIGLSGGIELADSATISTGTWYHVAATRSGATLRTFVNGVNGGTLTNNSNINNTNPVNVGFDGGSAATSRIWNGRIQNLIIYKGQALYTANFTPWMS